MKLRTLTLAAVMLLLCATGCGKETDRPAAVIPSETTGEAAAVTETAATVPASETETTVSAASDETTDTGTAAATTQNATAQTTAAATAAATSAPPAGVQISRIAGEYFYEVPDPADNSRWILDGTVSIATNGTYTYFPNSGAPVKGKIVLTPEEYSNGDTVWWYSFYPAAGDMWIGITASLVMEEGYHFLYTGNGGTTRLEVNTADGNLIWEDLREHWCDDMPLYKIS